MSKVLNAVKEKMNYLKQRPLLRTVLICSLALLLIFSVTLAWYINNLGLWGMEFNTGTIDFNTYVYSESGDRLVGPYSSNDEDKGKYMNAPLITLNDAQVGSTGVAYIVVESTGSIGIQYRIAFDITGRDEKSTVYLGGYKYNITKVTDKVEFTGGDHMDVTRCPRPEKIEDEVVVIDRNAVNGTIEKKQGYDVYRVDYTLVHKNEEYTGNGINIYFNIFATQIGGDFEDSQERGYTYYCSTREDIDRARVEAYPGDIIKLSSDIVYYGDLVFNKPISLETNDFTLTVNGNLIYDYVLGNSLRLDAGGLGKIVVQCTNEGIGGNLQIKAPIGDVSLIGSNAANGDIVVEKNIVIDATNSFGSAGVSFNEVRIVDLKNSRKTIQLDSNTRATVSFGTTIGLLQSVVKANNIEIINNGVIGEINLSNMYQLPQTNSPQIYILNNNDINSPIMLPKWSVKFVQDASGNCTGNTRIIQSYSGGPMEVTGNCDFENADIEVEKKDFLVERIEENNDSRLKIYYQDVDGQVTTIRSILENYLKYEATTGCTINEVQQLEIISIGDKAVTNDDIAFMNSDEMRSLKQLDMQRANVYDESTGTAHRLPDNAFYGVSKYEELVLPQNLVAIGDTAFSNSNIGNFITIPSGVNEFGYRWFYQGKYVRFAASIPVTQEADAMTNVNAIFVDEAYISSYKSLYSQHATRIYPSSVLDETKEHFVRNTIQDEWEITYYISGSDSVIGKNITIDGTVLKITSVYDNAYRHNFTGTEVSFADSVANLGAGNFYANKKLAKVNLNNIKTVGNEAFRDCTTLSQVTFGDYLQVIGDNAFMNCTSLHQDVVLPDSMQTIGREAFRKTLITSINTGGTTSVEALAFSFCTELIYAELPNVTLVGESGTNQLFGFSSALVSVSMPSLKQANGERMFYNCVSLRELYLASNDDDLTLGSDPYYGCNTKKLKLFVPAEHLEFYQNKRPGDINATMIYPQGEKMGEELVNGFNIGTYIVSKNTDDTYTLITSNVEHSGDYAIPTTYEGKAITKIHANAFRNQSFTDVKLKLGNNVKIIGDSAFYSLTGLIKVDFGNSLEVIGGTAFAYCSGLSQDVVLPASMESIEGGAFRKTSILSLNTGGTTSVDARAFYECTSLTYVVMPEVTDVAVSGTNEVFAYSSSLVRAEMPKVTRVSGSKMFHNCSSLLELYMESDNTSISLGTYPVTGTHAQIKLFVPEELVTLYKGRNILNEKQVYPIGEKLGSLSVNGVLLGDYVVLNNGSGYTLVTSNLDFTGDVTVPNTYNSKPITEIYANAFRNQTFTDVNLVLGDNVKVIGSSAFYGLTGLKSIVMNQVTTVGAEAFRGCGIQLLNAPKVTSLGGSAFRSCASLEMVNLPLVETVTEQYALAECAKLKSVYFENVMSLHQYTFFGDKKLEKITINKLINSDASNMPATMTIDASAPCKIYVPYRSLSAYPSTWSGKPVVSFDISATSGGNTYILKDNNGRYALIDFVPGSAITSLTIPTTVSAAQIGNISIYSIEEGAFVTAATTLKKLTLSSTIAQLDGAALSECTALTNISVSSSNVYFTSVSGVLYSKDARMLVKFPVGKTGKFDMTATAYASTVGIGAGAFANATELTQIVFPSSLMVIDSTAFTGCSKLSSVEFTGTTPPVLMGAGIFDTSVEGFKMTIPTTDSSVVTAYLCAFNFGEYEPYIDLNGNAAPSAGTARNQVHLDEQAARSRTYALLNTSKMDEEEEEETLPEDDTSGE